jgi:hypothetical protein
MPVYLYSLVCGGEDLDKWEAEFMNEQFRRDFFMDFSVGKGVWFSIRFPPFSFLQRTVTEL